MDKPEKKALSDILEYGCHIIHVLSGDNSPPFSYSIGIWKTSRRPELIVIGMAHKYAQEIINEYNRRARLGEDMQDGQLLGDLVEGDFDCLLRRVDEKYFADYMGWNRWFYQGNEFPALQLILPTTSGLWPWELDVSSATRKAQPILASPIN